MVYSNGNEIIRTIEHGVKSVVMGLLTFSTGEERSQAPLFPVYLYKILEMLRYTDAKLDQGRTAD